MGLEHPQPPPSDGVVLLRPWEDRDLSLSERASQDEYVALIERLPLPFTPEAGSTWIEAPRRVLEKLGFQREGLLRAYTSRGGERRDVDLYSLLPGELR